MSSFPSDEGVYRFDVGSKVWVRDVSSNGRGYKITEATVREHFSHDGQTFLDEEKRNSAMRLMITEGTEARQDYTKIKSPALAITVAGFPSKMTDRLKTLPEARRNAMAEFLSYFNGIKEQEAERFRKELPGARILVLTNADHHCFIDREDEVVREMRKFLAEK